MTPKQRSATNKVHDFFYPQFQPSISNALIVLGNTVTVIFAAIAAIIQDAMQTTFGRCYQVIDDSVSEMDAELTELRRFLHAHPEPSGEEVQTTRLVLGRLEEAGLEPHICHGGLGLIADLELGHPAADAPRIAVRADMDALRLVDEKDVPYASQNHGVTHACGHDAHTTITYAAAKTAMQLRAAMAECEPGVGVKLRFIFQPAEETCEGAKSLVEQGVLKGVDAILALHLDPERPVGDVGVRDGFLTANCDEVDFFVQGRGGHAARPHHSIDPIAAASQLVGALYQYIPRSVDSRDPAVFTVGKIVGGYAANVIPESVELLGTLRTIGRDTRSRIIQRIREITHGVSESSGVKITVEFRNPLASVDNDQQINRLLTQAARDVLGDSHVKQIDKPSMGSEDFGVYLEHVPGAMYRLGCAAPNCPAHFLHSPKFDIDEQVLQLGPRIFLRAALLISQELKAVSEG